MGQVTLARTRPIRPGASISYRAANPGTACVAVRRRVGKDQISRFLLTCEHVLFGLPGVAGRTRSPVSQPAQTGAGATSDHVATVHDAGGLNKHGINHIDAALAQLYDGVEMSNVPLNASQKISRYSNGIDVQDKVIMYGSASGR